MGNGGCTIVDPNLIKNLSAGTTRQGNSEVVVSMGNAGGRSDIVMTDKVVSPLLPFSDKVEVVTRERPWFPSHVVPVELCEREVRHTAQVGFARSEAGGGMDGVAVGGLDVKHVEIPVILPFVHKHGEHLGGSVAEAFHASISLGVVGASAEFVSAWKL